MSFSHFKKLRILSKTGLNIAEYPEEDLAHSQLSSGIMSAFMAFSKEVHQQELISINLQHSTLYFVVVNDLMVVLEMSIETDKEFMEPIMSVITEKANWLLKEYNSNNITLKHAKITMNELFLIITRYELLYDIDSLKEDLLFTNTQIFVASIYKSNFDKIETKFSDLKIIEEIYDCLKKSNLNLNQVNYLTQGVFKLPKNKNGVYLIVRFLPNQIQLGGLIVDERDIHNLVCLFDKFSAQFNIIKEMGYDFELDDVVRSMYESVETTKYTLNEEDFKFISFNALIRLIPEYDKIIQSIFMNKKIIIYGDKILSKIITKTLSLFALGRPINVRIDEEIEDIYNHDIISLDKEEFEKFKLLDQFQNLDENLVFVNVNNGSVITSELNKNNFIRNFIFDLIGIPNNEILKRVNQFLLDIDIGAVDYENVLKNNIDRTNPEKLSIITNLYKRLIPWGEFSN